jgi:hypothetical protein
MDGKLQYRSGVAVLAASLLALLLGGCLTPYAIPRIECTPRIDFDALKTDAHAFRVEGTVFMRQRFRFLTIPDYTYEYDLCEIPIEAGDLMSHVAPQYRFCVNRGLGLAGNLIGNDGKHVHHFMQVVLYRPGYKLVTILADPSGKPVSVDDSVAEPEPLDLHGQVDELESLCDTAARPRSVPVSPEHRKVLLLLISECERLAELLYATPMPRQHELVVGTPDYSTPPVELNPTGPIQMKLRNRADELRRLANAGTEKAAKPTILSANDAEMASKILKKQIEDAGRKGLPGLMGSPDVSLSLAAAWEHAVGPGTKAQPPLPKEFVKFFERRTGVKVPIEWEYEIALDAANSSPDWSQLRAVAEEEYKGLLDAVKLNASKPTVWLHDGIYEFADGKTTVRVPAANLPKPNDIPGHSIEAHVGPERTVIAFCDDYGSPFPLICVDSRTGKEVWRTTVWTTRSWPLFFHTGPSPTHYFEFSETKNRLMVFGYAFGCYAAEFDVENGKGVFHFTTDHWFPISSDDMARWRRNLRP